jgi:hypothetical protein
MTCFQRMHEVILGVTRPAAPRDWNAILWDWMGISDLHDRDHMLGRMGVDPIDIYLFPGADLHQYSGLIISPRVDQELLYREQDKIRAFLDDGKVVVYSGELFREWLPGARYSVPVDIRARGGIGVLTLAQHPLLTDIAVEDLGPMFVSAYYPTPPGAEVLATLPDGEAVLYVDRASTRGTIMVHAGVNLTTYMSEGASARQFVPRLIEWINSEARGTTGVITPTGARS